MNHTDDEIKEISSFPVQKYDETIKNKFTINSITKVFSLSATSFNS